MTPDQASLRQAVLANRNEELLRELQHAHRIIQNGLQIMSVTQTSVWGERNARDGVDGEGTTRYHERAAVLARATGSAA
ncbi:hypothetical protein [Cupriavidus sp. UBA2534]|uniref:hypothetical protein n=1 Tax=Cupriavidus sp. UBA2534 TaxID=1946399 RepID=UPI000E7F6FEE|nr:hypothetical protein [Cupriavidus sp. UBA2534]HBD35944.1 hypothetical protein [Cupriavidus sp.]HBO78687.1 hypothetical protein [Cupriavidus sp.]